MNTRWYEYEGLRHHVTVGSAAEKRLIGYGAKPVEAKPKKKKAKRTPKTATHNSQLSTDNE